MIAGEGYAAISSLLTLRCCSCACAWGVCKCGWGVLRRLNGDTSRYPAAAARRLSPSPTLRLLKRGAFASLPRALTQTSNATPPRHVQDDKAPDKLMAGPVMVKQEPAGSSRGGEADEVKETRHDKITAATTASSSGAPRVKGKGKAMPNIKKEAGVVATSRPRRTHEETSAAAASPAKKAKKEEDASTTINDDDKAALRDLLSKWTQPGTLLKITASEISPYPKQERPTPFEALYARDLLAALHGEPERDKLEENCSGQGTLLEKRARSVLDSLVRTILSQNTTDALSKRAFDNLKKHFPTYKQVLAAKPGEVEEVIKFAGLSEIKVGRIRAILTTVMKERPKECVGGEPSLEFLREMPTEEIKEYLGGFKGVGPKTIACVLLFTIGADDFAVDTHVWHIAKRLGWVPAAASREDTYKHLNNRIPDCVKYSLHVLLVLHGKKCVSCCKGRTQLTPDGPCPLGRVGKVRGELAGLVVAAAAAAAIEEGVVKKEEGGGGKKKGKGKAKTPAIKKEVV